MSKQLLLITCQVEWCGVAPLCVSAVNILWRAKFLDSCEAALLGSIQEGGITPQQVLDVCVSIFNHVQWYVAVTVLLGWVGSVLNREFYFFSTPIHINICVIEEVINFPLIIKTNTGHKRRQDNTCERRQKWNLTLSSSLQISYFPLAAAS